MTASYANQRGLIASLSDGEGSRPRQQVVANSSGNIDLVQAQSICRSASGRMGQKFAYPL